MTYVTYDSVSNKSKYVTNDSVKLSHMYVCYINSHRHICVLSGYAHTGERRGEKREKAHIKKGEEGCYQCKIWVKNI